MTKVLRCFKNENEHLERNSHLELTDRSICLKKRKQNKTTRTTTKTQKENQQNQPKKPNPTYQLRCPDCCHPVPCSFPRPSLT